MAAAVVASVAVVIALNLTIGEKRIERRVDRLYSVSDPQFRRSMSLMLGPSVIDGNKVEALVNGDEIFPAMLSAIRAAKTSITFESYIYWSGGMGGEFVNALSERARAGVPTHVLLDYFGSIKMEESSIDSLEAAGVEVERYHKPNWWSLTRLNNRTHRKLLVVDGTVGFTGGVGIADAWTGDAQDAEHWRDSHFRVTGPVVAQMQSVFMDNWIQATGRVLHGPKYFPALDPTASMPAHMFSSAPSGGSESMLLMYLMSITASAQTIDLSNAYFVPSELAVKSLVAAALRGVKIRIIVPGPIIDKEIVRSASRALWGPLLKAGIQIAEYQGTMFHVKSMVVDSLMVSVGSTNFDNRSFSINDEANINVYDREFALAQEETFANDWARAKVVTFEQWQARSWKEKLTEKIAILFRQQM